MNKFLTTAAALLALSSAAQSASCFAVVHTTHGQFVAIRDDAGMFKTDVTRVCPKGGGINWSNVAHFSGGGLSR